MKGGLVFNAAGNNGRLDSNPRRYYLIVVSAIDNKYGLASFSNYGNPIWFTAPGTAVWCSDRYGRAASVNGTSFASPICAAVAAMVWSANPALRNTQVEQILAQTCFKAGTATWTQWFGYGMPNAEAAVRRALGR